MRHHAVVGVADEFATVVRQLLHGLFFLCKLLLIQKATSLRGCGDDDMVESASVFGSIAHKNLFMVLMNGADGGVVEQIHALF